MMTRGKIPCKQAQTTAGTTVWSPY